MNYTLINDKNHLDDFISNILPDLKDSEVFFLALFARKKYGAKKDNILRRVTATKDTIYNKIRAMEIPLFGYKERDGSHISNSSLAVYINPNPRCQKKAAGNLLIELSKKIVDGSKINPVSLSLTCIQTAAGTKKWVHFDIDDPHFDLSFLKTILNLDAVTCIKTRGGYHLLVDPIKISKDYNKTFYLNIKGCPEVDVCGDQLLPIPGTRQGYNPTIVTEAFVPKVEIL